MVGKNVAERWGCYDVNWWGLMMKSNAIDLGTWTPVMYPSEQRRQVI